MICVSVEIREGALTYRARVSANWAPQSKGGYPCTKRPPLTPLTSLDFMPE